MFFSCNRSLRCGCSGQSGIVQEVEVPDLPEVELPPLQQEPETSALGADSKECPSARTSTTFDIEDAPAKPDSSSDSETFQSSCGATPKSETDNVLEQRQSKSNTTSKFEPLESDLPIFELDARRQKAAAPHLPAFQASVEAELANGGSQHRAFCSESTLLRYLCVCDGSEKRAKAMLMETLRWREKNLSGQCSCSACGRDPTSHCFLHIGDDAAGRHVVYSCAGRASSKVVEDGMRHMSLELERMFEGNSAPGQIVWVVDFAGFGLADCNPKTVYTALPMFANHYPERFAQIVLFSFPSCFRAIYHSAMKILDPVMRRKVLVLNTEEVRRRYAAHYWQCNAPMASWLEAAVKCEGSPGSYPDIRLSRELSVPSTREFLERCAAARERKRK